MSYVHERNNVSFPVSYIKPPGVLLKDKKDSTHVRNNNRQVQHLLDEFKSNLSTSSVFSTRDFTPTAQKENFCDDYESLFESLIKSHCPNFEMEPGKLKKMTDQTSVVINQAEKILSFYSLDLVIQDSQELKEIVNSLKALIPEICFFPLDFFQKIQIKKVIICKTEKVEMISDTGKIYFPLANLETKVKICRKLHKTILDYIVKACPNIVKTWERFEKHRPLTIEEGTSSDNLSCSLEDTFLGLMNPTRYTQIKLEIDQLRELLAYYYPEAMSEERFTNKNREKRKTTVKVHFDC